VIERNHIKCGTGIWRQGVFLSGSDVTIVNNVIEVEYGQSTGAGIMMADS
jgi:hypothetical protein